MAATHCHYARRVEPDGARRCAELGGDYRRLRGAVQPIWQSCHLIQHRAVQRQRRDTATPAGQVAGRDFVVGRRVVAQCPDL